MSVEEVESILRRVLDDSEFADEFINRPADAVSAFELTDDERDALVRGDMSALSDLVGDDRVVQDVKTGMADKCPQRMR